MKNLLVSTILLEKFVKEENIKVNFTYVAFFDLKKVYNSIPIFIIDHNFF